MMRDPERRSTSTHRGFGPLLVGVLLTIGCGDSDPSGPQPPVSTTEVGVVDNRFTPSANAVDIGATVIWSWSGANTHNVTFDDPSIGASVTQQSGSFERAFSDPGEYTYFCTVHGRAVMSGRVVVGG